VADCDLALTFLTFSRLFQSITDRDESKQLINETAGKQITTKLAKTTVVVDAQ